MNNVLLAANVKQHTVSGPLRFVMVRERTSHGQSARNPLDAFHGILIGLGFSAALWVGVAGLISLFH
jgi:hypothetical protein